MILPDANVWLSLATAGHISHPSSVAWLSKVPDDEGLAFCRITQLALLRLFTMRAVMGPDVLTQRQAWLEYELLLRTNRIVLIEEPAPMSSVFKELSQQDEASPKRWTDDYLAAFALAGQLQLVTYDRALASRVPAAILLTP